MKKKVGQIAEISKIEIQIEEITGSFPAPIIVRGNSYYIRLDLDFIRFWELKPGDEILVTVTKAKRETRTYEEGK